MFLLLKDGSSNLISKSRTVLKVIEKVESVVKLYCRLVRGGGRGKGRVQGQARGKARGQDPGQGEGR